MGGKWSNKNSFSNQRQHTQGREKSSPSNITVVGINKLRARMGSHKITNIGMWLGKTFEC